MRKLSAEFLGTFALVFAGTGAIVIDHITNGGVSHVGIALTFGLVVLAMIYSVGDISGAHFNPAVTIGFWVAGRLPGRQVGLYMLSQTLGALAASGILRLLFSNQVAMGSTLPAGPGLPPFRASLDLSGRAPVGGGSGRARLPLCSRRELLPAIPGEFFPGVSGISGRPIAVRGGRSFRNVRPRHLCRGWDHFSRDQGFRARRLKSLLPRRSPAVRGDGAAEGSVDWGRTVRVGLQGELV